MPAGLRMAPIVLLAACGRVGFEEELPPEAGCDWDNGPQLQEPEPLAGFNTEARERAPFVTAGLETLYFSSDADGTLDFYMAEVDVAETFEFGPAQRFEDLSSGEADTSLSFAADHQEVFFSSTRGGGSTFELFRARRPSLSAPFVEEDPVAGLSDGEDDLAPHLAQGDRALYFASAPGGGPRDLYVARRSTVDDDFGDAELIAELSSEADDTSPALTSDGRTLVFASSRGDSTDLYYASRASTDEPFGSPVMLASISSDGVDTDPFVTSDGCYLYFASDRQGGQLDLFVARAFR